MDVKSERLRNLFVERSDFYSINPIMKLTPVLL